MIKNANITRSPNYSSMSMKTSNNRNRKRNYSNNNLENECDENEELKRHSTSQLEYVSVNNSIRKIKTNNLTNASNFHHQRPVSKPYVIDLSEFKKNVNSSENECSTQSTSKGTLF